MKRKFVITAAAVSVLTSVLVIFGTQFLSGGSNPEDGAMLALGMVIGGGLQVLARAAIQNRMLNHLPLLAAAGIAGWGTRCYLFSPAWVNASIADLTVDYYSFLFGCLAVLLAELHLRKRKT